MTYRHDRVYRGAWVPGQPPEEPAEPAEPEGDGTLPPFFTGWSSHVPIDVAQPDPDPIPWGCDGFGTPWPEEE